MGDFFQISDFKGQIGLGGGRFQNADFKLQKRNLARRADFKLQIAVFRFHEAGGTYSRLQIAKAKTAQIMQFGRLQKAKMLTWQNSARQTFSSQECKFQISKLAPPGLAKAECRMQNADWTSSRILRGLLQIAKFRLHMPKRRCQMQ